jgi:hypothetical protein
MESRVLSCQPLGRNSMARLTNDLRFALRQILRSPGFAITAVVTLALAIGANTAIFTLLNQALLRALPVKDPSQLVVLSYSGSREGHKESQGGDSLGHDHYFSYPMYRDLRDNSKVFSGLAAAAPASAGVSWNNRAEQVPLEMVSGNYFQTLGVQPAAGRLLLPGDETTDKADPVAVLSFDYWTSRLAQAAVVGKTLLINGYPFSIVGVAAPGFHTMVWGRHPDLYVPITMQTVIEPEWSYLSDHRSYWLNIVGRLHPGETPQQAMAGVNPLWVSLRTSEFPLLHDQSAKSREAFISRTQLNLDSGAQGFSPYRDDLRTPLLIMMGMVVLVMAMAGVRPTGRSSASCLQKAFCLAYRAPPLVSSSHRVPLEFSSPGWQGAIRTQPFPPPSIGGFCSTPWPLLSLPACSSASPLPCSGGTRVSPSPSSSRPEPAPEARCSSAAPAWRCRSASACC